MTSNELQDIIITIDTREQNQKRISAVEAWGERYGAIVEHSKLDLCDYRILGDFRGNPVNIGIEAKSLSDFCSCDYNDLKEKLFNSYDLYDEVALFIEVGNYSFQTEGFGKSIIINPAVRDGSANVCNLAQLEGCTSTLSQYGVHVRYLRSELQFSYSIENLLTYSINNHHLIKSKSFIQQYKQTLLTFVTPTQMKKLITHYPNLFWLCSAGEDEYQTILGKKTGTHLYNFIRNPELMTEEWKSGHYSNGTEIQEENPIDDDLNKVTEMIINYLAGFPEGRTPDEICDHFGFIPGDKDKEKMLQHLKTLAWSNEIDSLHGRFYVHKIKTSQSSSTEISKKEDTHDKLQSQCDPAESEENFSKKSIIPHNPPLSISSPADDNDKTSSGLTPLIIPDEVISDHTGSVSDITPPTPKPDDTQGAIQPPHPTEYPLRPDVQKKASKKKSATLTKSSPPSSANTLTEDEQLFGKTNPDWKEPDTHKLSLRVQLEHYLENPHTLQECVDTFDMFRNGTVWEHVMKMKKEGVVTEFDDKTFVMKKI